LAFLGQKTNKQTKKKNSGGGVFSSRLFRLFVSFLVSLLFLGAFVIFFPRKSATGAQNAHNFGIFALIWAALLFLALFFRLLRLIFRENTDFSALSARNSRENTHFRPGNARIRAETAQIRRFSRRMRPNSAHFGHNLGLLRLAAADRDFGEEGS
jgi:hypothetical protein